MDSLDEGVGDVSSDGEQLSPGPGCHKNIVQAPECPINSQSMRDGDNSSYNSSLERKISSPSIERMPSRFSFNNTA